MDREAVSDESKDLPVELMWPTPEGCMTGTGWLNVFAGTFFFMLGMAGGVFAGHDVNHPAARQGSTSVPPIFYLLPAGVSLFGLLLVRRLPLQHRLRLKESALHGCITECSDPSRSGLYLQECR
jgi:hypothetical protein